MSPCPPSSNRACSFPAPGFPMFFTVRHALSSSLLLSAPYIICISRKEPECQIVHTRFLYTRQLMSLNITVLGLQHWTANLLQHAVPATPGDHMSRFRFLSPYATAFPIRSQGGHLQYSLSRLPVGSLALRSAALPIGNLRPLVFNLSKVLIFRPPRSPCLIDRASTSICTSRTGLEHKQQYSLSEILRILGSWG